MSKGTFFKGRSESRLKLIGSLLVYGTKGSEKSKQFYNGTEVKHTQYNQIMSRRLWWKSKIKRQTKEGHSNNNPRNHGSGNNIEEK